MRLGNVVLVVSEEGTALVCSVSDFIDGVGCGLEVGWTPHEGEGSPEPRRTVGQAQRALLPGGWRGQGPALCRDLAAACAGVWERGLVEDDF